MKRRRWHRYALEPYCEDIRLPLCKRSRFRGRVEHDAAVMNGFAALMGYRIRYRVVEL